MKFSAEQAVRVECVSCPEIYIGADMPLRWEGIEESDDSFYSHRGRCPRCSGADEEDIPGTHGEADEGSEEAERRAIQEDAGIRENDARRRSCGSCIHLGPESLEAAYGWHKCGREFRVPGGLTYQPRVLPHHGTECPFFEGME